MIFSLFFLFLFFFIFCCFISFLEYNFQIFQNEFNILNSYTNVNCAFLCYEFTFIITYIKVLSTKFNFGTCDNYWNINNNILRRFWGLRRYLWRAFKKKSYSKTKLVEYLKKIVIQNYAVRCISNCSYQPEIQSLSDVMTVHKDSDIQEFYTFTWNIQNLRYQIVMVRAKYWKKNVIDKGDSYLPHRPH